MPGITFDTLGSVKTLRAAGFQEAQAEALVVEMKKIQESAITDLATKGDISEIKTSIKELEIKIRELELRMETRLAETKADLIKWVLGISFAQAALIVTLLKLIK